MSIARFPIQLPDPDDRTTADLIIFDGQCRFCRGQVQRLARWDHGQRLAFISAHDPRVAQRFPQLTHEQLMQDMYLIDAQGESYRGAEVVKYLSSRLPMLWLLAPWLHIPGSLPVWQWLYRQVAKRRYLWGKVEACDEGTCHIHDR